MVLSDRQRRARAQPRDKRGHFLSTPKSIFWDKRRRWHDRKTGRFISKKEVQRRARIEKARKRVFLVIFTTYETRGGKKTKVWLQIEVMVAARNLADAEMRAWALISRTVPPELGELWEAMDWLVGVERLPPGTALDDRAIFRKLGARGGPVKYTFKWKVRW